MKTSATLITSLSLWLAAVPAFAVDTTKVYTSGIMVIIFLGICALIVIAQLVPALLILMGSVKSLIKGALKNKGTVEEKN
jgi:hypothetical protein